MQYFSSKQAIADLQNITKAFEQTQELFEKSNTGMGKLAALIRARNLSTSSELFLFTVDGKSVNPYSYIVNFPELNKIREEIQRSDSDNIISFSRKLFDEKIAKCALNAANAKNNGEIYSFSSENQKYHAVKLTLFVDNTALRVLFISQGNFSHDFVHFANMILLVISAIIIFIAMFTAKYVVRAISNPIEYITSVVGQAEKDKFITLENSSNINELKILSEKINEMSKRGYDYTQAQKMFFQSVSHELRTPLANIQGYAEGMEHGVFTDIPKYSHIIGAEVTRLSNLVNDILSLARIESDALHYEFKKISASKSIKNILQTVQQSPQSSSIEIKFNSAFDDEIYIDDALFNQAIFNVLYNAFRYAKSCIAISVTTDDDNVMITIADDGEGVSPQDQPYIFNKFYKGKGGHFGLGLAIAQSAMECMRGTLSLENGEIGASFVIRIPKY